MKTLAQLVNEYDANGFVIDDAGNGCAGRSWVEWTDDIAAEYGATPMYETGCDDFVGVDWPHSDTLLQVIQDVIDYVRPNDSKLWASEVITDSKGYSYRVIF